MPKVRPVKVDPKFKDRLYLLNNAQDLAGKASHAVWNNPMGGALEWNFNPQIGIVDTKGDYRWYLFTNPIYSLDSLYYGGDMMGFRQNKDGAFTWGYGQRYVMTATSSTNSVSSTSSTPIARTSSRRSTRVRCASTSMLPRPGRPSPKKTSRS